MLEADPEELVPGGASALADHLGECARCRSVAAELTAGVGILASHLEHAPAAGSLESTLLAVRSRRRFERRRRM
jgi:anti-sigma factor ChrR (cupin superfamily)